jgi:hypothetical protein
LLDIPRQMPCMKPVCTCTWNCIGWYNPPVPSFIHVGCLGISNKYVCCPVWVLQQIGWISLGKWHVWAHQAKIGAMTHRDKFEFVNELCSTTNREFACAIWRRLATPAPRESITRNAHCALRKGFPLRPCMARAILAYTGKHYNVAYIHPILLHALTCDNSFFDCYDRQVI